MIFGLMFESLQSHLELIHLLLDCHGSFLKVLDALLVHNVALTEVFKEL